MLKSIHLSILSLIGIISFGVWACADDFQVELANIIISRTFPGKYPQLQGVHLKSVPLSFNENLSLKRGVRVALNAKKSELLSNTLISNSEIPVLTIEPVGIEFIEKPPFLTSLGRKIESTLDPSILGNTPKQLNLRRSLMSNNYTVNIFICIKEKKPLRFHPYAPPLPLYPYIPPLPFYPYIHPSLFHQFILFPLSSPHLPPPPPFNPAKRSGINNTEHTDS
jgi:hypothetical protein